MGFFSKLFSSGEDERTQQEKENARNFDILKFDGVKAQKMGRLDYSIKCLAEALTIMDDYATRIYLAQSYSATGEMELALEQLRHASELDADNPDPYLMTAQIASVTKDYNLMNDACLKVMSIDANRADAHYWSGVACNGLGDMISAIAMLTRAIMLDESYQPPYILRAEILENMGQIKEAMEDVEKLISLDGENESYLTMKGRLLLKFGNIREADEVLTQLIENNPFNIGACLDKVSILAMDSRLEECVTLLDEAIENNPSSSQLYKTRGAILNQMGESARAIDDLKKSLELEPKEGEVISGEFTNIEQEMNQKMRDNNPFLQ